MNVKLQNKQFRNKFIANAKSVSFAEFDERRWTAVARKFFFSFLSLFCGFGRSEGDIHRIGGIQLAVLLLIGLFYSSAFISMQILRNFTNWIGWKCWITYEILIALLVIKANFMFMQSFLLRLVQQWTCLCAPTRPPKEQRTSNKRWHSFWFSEQITSAHLLACVSKIVWTCHVLVNAFSFKKNYVL